MQPSLNEQFTPIGLLLAQRFRKELEAMYNKRIFKTSHVVALIVLAASPAVAQQTENQQQAENGQQEAPAPTQTMSPQEEAMAQESDRALTPQNIADAVDTALQKDDGVKANRITVAPAENYVVLGGTVGSLEEKQRAERVAETVKGVEQVTNNMIVQVEDQRSDKAIRYDVEAALKLNPATRSYNVDVEVNDGRVSLTGEVERWETFGLIGQIASGVRGVTAVDNNVLVQPLERRVDEDLEDEIRSRLHWDARVDDSLVQVEVNEGKARLIGTVGSAAEKRRAQELARQVPGVKIVYIEQIEVQRWARDDAMREGKYGEKADEDVHSAVRNALSADPRIKPDDVTVFVDRGMVALRGEVDTLKAKRKAEDIARNINGVWRVTNRLEVVQQEEGAATDSDLAKRVREALNRQPYLGEEDINISASNGEITLEGAVETYFRKEKADDVASRIPEVEEIVNRLEVKDQEKAPTYSDYVDDWTPYDFDWAGPTTQNTFLSDAEIRRNVTNELWWSPFVDNDDVDISVDNGQVVLTGTVDTWAEQEAAEQNAFEGGATSVINNLEVRYDPGEGMSN